MKFIHTSDWHIGRQFHGISLLEEQRVVLQQIIEQARVHNIDALVIAGDIYDRAVPPAAAVSLLDDVLNQVCNELKVPVLLIPGNHDSAERLSFGARQLSQVGLYVLSDLKAVSVPITVTGQSGVSVNFYGIPFNDPVQLSSEFDIPCANYQAAHSYLIDTITESMSREQINVLISHCFVDGGSVSDSERPLSIGGIDRVSYQSFVAFNYVALGHLHNPQSCGEAQICYSGSILKYSFSEQSQKKGVNLIEFDGLGVPTIRQLNLAPIRDRRTIEGSLDTLIAQAKNDPNADDYLLIKLDNTHALLNAMEKLRAVYPNLLMLDRSKMMAVGQHRPLQKAQLKIGELQVFREFYKQAKSKDLSVEQAKLIEGIIEKIYRDEA